MIQKSLSLCIVLLSLFVLPERSSATDRFYPDIEQFSPGKRFRLRAKSPDNATIGHAAFQEDFVYEFFDTQTNKILWTHEQKGSKRPEELAPPGVGRGWGEGSPAQVVMTDDGWTAVYTGMDQLICFNAQGEMKAWSELIDEGMTEKERGQYVHQTTAGPMWAGLSHWYFLESDESKSHFAIRPWWGRRIFVDLSSGQLVDDFDARTTLDEIATDSETEFVLETLPKISISKANDDDPETVLGGGVAIFLAGKLKIKDAAEELSRIQESEACFSSCYSGESYGKVWKRGSVDPYSYETRDIRQLAQLSLRRIGVTPKLLPVYHFLRFKEDERYLSPIPKLKRSATWKDAKKEMTGEEILSLLGSPDAVLRDEWEYDIDGEKPFTLKIAWDGQKVERISQVTAKWIEGTARDEALAY